MIVIKQCLHPFIQHIASVTKVGRCQKEEESSCSVLTFAARRLQIDRDQTSRSYELEEIGHQ